MIEYGSKTFFADEAIVVGDIHGNYEVLQKLLDQVLHFLDNPLCHLIFAGDFVNRGNNVPKVVQTLMQLKKDYPDQIFVLTGNHETMLEMHFNGNLNWKQYTYTTINQYRKFWNLSSKGSLKLHLKQNGILEFFDNLLPYYENDSLIVTHAPLDLRTCLINGLMPYEEDFKEKEIPFRCFLGRILFELMWGFVNDPKEEIPKIKKYLVCGHQVVKQPVVLNTRAFIDTGCGIKIGNPLTAIKFPERRLYSSILF